MKTTLLTFILTVSFSGLADTRREFDENTEKKCHQELKTMGCVKANDQESSECSEKNKKKLSSACLEIHESRKQK